MDRAKRRKNEWKFAVRRTRLIDGDPVKPLHYYASNPPWNSYSYEPNKTNNKGSRRYISKNYKPSKNWNEHDKRQLDSFNSQIEELQV